MGVTNKVFPFTLFSIQKILLMNNSQHICDLGTGEQWNVTLGSNFKGTQDIDR